MPASEAQINANRQNAARSTGPRTPEGKETSRRNALKHGLTGEGVVLPNEDVTEVERRLAGFREELQPSGDVGEALARRAAFLSVRLDRCTSQETAALSLRIRQAEADFVAPEGLDPAKIEHLKAEAKALAMFDPSKEATLARSYEAAAERGFFRALKELRLIEKQAKEASAAAENESFEQAMASFLQLQKEGDELEAKYLEPHERTSAILGQRHETSRFAPATGPVDVPFTIGRRR